MTDQEQPNQPIDPETTPPDNTDQSATNGGSGDQDPLKSYGNPDKTLLPVVFGASAGLILVFVILTLVFRSQALSAFNAIQAFIAETSGWFYILAVNIFLLASIALIFTPWARIRLGGPDAKPEFSMWGWFSMLFSAGMGIGLVFWSVAEPIYHFASPPFAEPHSAAGAREAMTVSFYHWGLHAWGIYAVVALALAYFAFNRNQPLTIRSAFYPLLGDRIHGPVGTIIDTVAVLATMFGVATSLGFGVMQVNAGLDYLFGIPSNLFWQVLLIGGITALATVSVVLGLDAGIRRLSELNMWLAGGLLLFVLLLGPTVFIFDGLVQNVGDYLSRLPRLAFWTETYPNATWQHGWTIFYWGWWISWAPFVGMFIARISRGRTIREFLLGVLLVPTLITFIWLAVFGNAAIFEETNSWGFMEAAVTADVSTALFELLSRYPLGFLASFLGIIVVISFFVTSSDSGSLVIDTISAGGHPNPPTWQRVFWAVTEGVVAATLLIGGINPETGSNDGLAALQTAAVTTGLPFTIVLLFMVWGLIKALNEDYDPPEEPHRRTDPTGHLPKVTPSEPAPAMALESGASDST